MLMLSDQSFAGCSELRLALGHQSSSLYIAAAVTAASLAAAAYFAAKLRQHQR